MIISKVLSYKGAWEDFLSNNKKELDDILVTIPDFLDKYQKSKNRPNGPSTYYRDLWDQRLHNKGWDLIERTFYSEAGQRIQVGNLGPIKNNICVTISIGHFDFLNRWLFQQSILACKYKIARIPVMLVPTDELVRKQDERAFMRFSFEMYQRQIEPLAPLSHAYPFLILGYNDQHNLFDTEVFELEADPLVQNENIVVDRCIEFPPEFYHAGINILNFFGTYIREQYPNEDAKVKIEQNGNIVRLIIETKEGKSEIIEKALEEYQLIVSGKQTPESIITKDKLVLEMKNELRIARYRIESQQDIIQIQNNRIDQLLTIVGNGLSAKNHILVDFHPHVSANSTVTINQDVSMALGNISELKELIPSSNPGHIALNELEGSLEAIESEKNPEVVKRSPAMTKFKRLIDTITDGETEISKAIKAAETGWDIFKDLAGKYNKIAQWCGLPQVPTIFTK